eukprot:scaffold692_cov118-Cylindrotheca_fusiformis.AAC.10
MEGEVEEETWTNADGSNVFDDQPFQKQLRVSKIANIFSDRSLFFESYDMNQMTPLDMTYDDEKKNRDEFYDGTGSLVWLASIAFCHLVAEDAIVQLIPETNEELRICELGCGVGLASIATLMANPKDCFALFTDNDPEALDLSRKNCVLNSLEPDSYRHILLSWGDSLPESDSNGALREGSFDCVLATDVIYDVSMIPPLLQTTSSLLRWNGHFIVSHVPRFCLPVRQENETATRISDDCAPGPSSCCSSELPQQKLEIFILEQAKSQSLQLIDTLRPHQVLKNIPTTKQSGPRDDSRNTISRQNLQEAHAVLFVFEKVASID